MGVLILASEFRTPLKSVQILQSRKILNGIEFCVGEETQNANNKIRSNNIKNHENLNTCIILIPLKFTCCTTDNGLTVNH